MNEVGVSEDRFADERGAVFLGSPFEDAKESGADVVIESATQAAGVCRCSVGSSEPAVFHEVGQRVGPEGAHAPEPEAISLDAILQRALENAVRSEPTEVQNLRWIHDDLRGWLAVRSGFAPGLPWSLADAWDRATKMLGVLSTYIERRRFELPGDREFVRGAAILVGKIGQVLAHQGLGGAAAHNQVWMTAEAAEAEARGKAA